MRKPTNGIQVPFQLYLIWVEPAGDLFFSPEGICMIDEERHYRIYSEAARHNVLRAAALKYSIDELLNGVEFRGSIYRFEDLSNLREVLSLRDASVAATLRALYEKHPQRFHFLGSSVYTM